MGLSSFKFVHWAPKDAPFLHQSALCRQGCSGSYKVDNFGTNRKRIYDFLLVGNCDCGNIFHRFWDTVTYWLKIAYFATFLLPLSHSAPSLIMFPLEFRVEFNHQETSHRAILQWRPHDRSLSRFGMIPACDTDGRSHRQNLPWLIQRSA